MHAQKIEKTTTKLSAMWLVEYTTSLVASRVAEERSMHVRGIVWKWMMDDGQMMEMMLNKKSI